MRVLPQAISSRIIRIVMAIGLRDWPGRSGPMQEIRGQRTPVDDITSASDGAPWSIREMLVTSLRK
jgi:hypothetical protein